jgi:hypothetical protein
MKRSELKNIIREVVEEVMKDDFSPLGVAQEWRLDEKAPPDFPKKLHDKLLKQYKDDEGKAYATMWKIFYAKKDGNKKINEMWMAFEGKDHDETNMNNPEEKREVELAKKAKEAAEEILKMHGK